MSHRTITTYRDFWPFYLGEHRKAATRTWHLCGTGLVLCLGVLALVSGNFWWLLAMPLAGYGFAWASHALIEKNRPATFTYPLWSLYSDFRMFGLWCAGKLDGEVKRHLKDSP